MVPSIVTVQAALERHAEFRRTAAGARVGATRATTGEPGRAFARRVRTLPTLREILARPRPA